MTVSGVVNFNPTCECGGMNTTAFVPAAEGDGCTSAGFTLAGSVTCSPGGSSEGYFSWQISCDDTTVYLRGTFEFSQGQGEGLSVTAEFPKGTSCHNMSASGNDLPYPPAFPDFCDYSQAILTMVPIVQ
jgi:hypothetical protein